MNNKKNNRVFTEATALLWICVLAGVAFLALYSLINILVAEPPFWVGIVLTLADLVCALAVYLVYKKFNEREASFSSRTIELDDAMKSMMKSVDIPCVLTLKNGVILWANAGTYRMLGSEGGLLQKNFYDYSRIRIDDIITSLSENGIVSIRLSYDEFVRIRDIRGSNYLLYAISCITVCNIIEYRVVEHHRLLLNEADP